MASSMIRKLYNEGSGLARSGMDAAKESIVPAAAGLAIGAASTRMSLDAGPVPKDALAGFAIRSLSTFRSHLPSVVRGPLGKHRALISEVSSALIVTGMARVGARLAGGHASHHGELGLPPTMGIDGLVAQAAKL